MLAAKKGGDLTPAVFTYGDAQQVRTLVLQDQPWFVAKDVCGVLGLANSRDALKGLDDDEVTVSPMATPSRGRVSMQLVNESGLYNLIFRSRKAEAKAFRRWVTGEVLPSIRRTGGYQKPQAAKPKAIGPKAAALPPAARPGQLEQARHWWDARHLPYDIVTFLGGEVRTITLQAKAWYSLVDVLKALKSGSNPMHVARALPHNHRHGIWLYGTSQYGWFVDDTGLRMVAVARGVRIGQLTLDLNAPTS